MRDKPVLLMDCDHPHFSVRTLLVGASRVTEGRHLFVASRVQEREVLARATTVPEPTRYVKFEEEEEGDDFWED